MAIKVGITGSGASAATLCARDGHRDIDFVAVNDITDTKTLAHSEVHSILGNLHATSRPGRWTA